MSKHKQSKAAQKAIRRRQKHIDPFISTSSLSWYREPYSELDWYFDFTALDRHRAEEGKASTKTVNA